MNVAAFKKKSLYLLMFFLTVFMFHSCELDEDIDPNADDPAAIFLGSWSVSDNATKLNYTVSIQRNPGNSTEVLIQNFAGSGDQARALVTGRTLTLTSSIIGNNWRVSGSGNYKNSSRIDFNYSLTIAGDQENRFALFTR